MSAPSTPEPLAHFTWRRGLVLVVSFAAWSAVAAPLFPLYAQVVAPAAEWLLGLLQPHGIRVTFSAAFPNVAWDLPGQATSLSRVPFRLLAYNSVLFLTLVTVWPRLGLRRRALVAAAGLPLLFAFHVADLCLAVESRLLTHLRPGSYDLGRGLDLWFLAVKYYHSFSVLALKQVLPFFLVWGLAAAARRRWPAARNSDGAPP